jgi:hypothetical protein
VRGLTKLVSVTVHLSPLIRRAAALIGSKVGSGAPVDLKPGSDINLFKIIINIILK